MSDIPTETEQVKKRYATPTYERYDRRKKIVRDLEGQFDRWLQSVKAEAWDEGFDSGHYAADWESRDCDCRKNPYRKEEE